MANATTTPIIRRATSRDAGALTALGRRTFTDAFGAENSSADLAAFLDATYTVDLQHRELHDAALTYLVVEFADELVAFSLLRAGRPSPFVADPTALELQRFYVDQRSHGSGIAQALMAACVTHAANAGAHTLFLGVWERNARALRFYAAQGFVDVGTQTFRVGQDPQLDRVLARPIAPTSTRNATALSGAP